jgi:hypothetical protein
MTKIGLEGHQSKPSFLFSINGAKQTVCVGWIYYEKIEAAKDLSLEAFA